MCVRVCVCVCVCVCVRVCMCVRAHACMHAFVGVHGDTSISTCICYLVHMLWVCGVLRNQWDSFVNRSNYTIFL